MQAKASAFTAGPPEFKVRSNIGNDFGQIGSKENEGERPPGLQSWLPILITVPVREEAIIEPTC